MLSTRRRDVARLLLPALVWLVCVVYVALRLTRGWVPHDEGSIAQSAARVLAGELPHRDFGELYTGGLTYYHALAFRVLGVSLVSLRIAMFVVFAAWVPATYALAARVAPPLGAAALTLLAVAWSVPNYPASLPSWYNLFLATFGTLALLHHADTGRRRWLVVAGVCGGLSFLAKLVGVFFVAGGLLFLVYREQWLAARDADAAERGADRPAWAYATLVTLALAAFAAALLAVVRGAPRLTWAVHFAVPGVAIAALLAWRAWRAPTSLGGSAERVARLLRLTLPFLAGAALPVAAMMLRYAAAGALGDFVQGVFVLPQKRLAFAATRPPSPLTFLVALPLLGVLAAVPPAAARARRALVALIVLVGALLLWRSADAWWAFVPVWLSVRALPPMVAVAGALLLARRSGGGGARSTPDSVGPAAGAVDVVGRASRDQVAMLLLSAMSTFALVQYPFAAPVYFCYLAPLAVLGTAAVVSLRLADLGPEARRRAGPALGAVVAFYAAFAVIRLHPGYIYDLGLRYHPVAMHARLPGERGGLRVTAADSAEAAVVASIVSAHARPGDFIYAGPDAPEVYFLTGMRNPTPTLFDFFDDPATRDARVLRAIDARGVRVAVVDTRPGFSAPPSAALVAGLRARFAQGAAVGRFAIGWR